MSTLRCRSDLLVSAHRPTLPPEVKEIKFSVHYRGHRVDVALAVDHMEVRSRPGGAPPIKVLVRDHTIELSPGTQHKFSLENRP